MTGVKKNLIADAAITVLVCCFTVTGCHTVEHSDIAIYTGEGADDDCITATRCMLEWAGYSVSDVSASYINSHGLEGFRLLCIPGGNMYQYALDISPAGKQKIRDFVETGGAYIGICGGANFAGERVYWQGNLLQMEALAMFPGATRGPVDEIAPYPYCTMCQLLTAGSLHSITASEPDSMWILYIYGPMLQPDSGADVVVLGEYEIVHEPAMVAFEYGRGRVFVIGAHPEFEEDGDRDSVVSFKQFDDDGSDWNMMRNAVMWCLHEL
jgi:glutamine amidotransferase-like uncharacterized protein